MMSRMQSRLKRHGHGHKSATAGPGSRSTPWSAPLPTRSLPGPPEEPTITIDAHADAGALLDAFEQARERKFSAAPSAPQLMAAYEAPACEMTDGADAAMRGGEVGSDQVQAQGKGQQGWKSSLQVLLGQTHGRVGGDGNYRQSAPIRDGGAFVPSRVGHTPNSAPAVTSAYALRTRAHGQAPSSASASATEPAPPFRLHSNKLQL